MTKVETSAFSRNTLFFFLFLFLGLTAYIFQSFLLPVLLALIFVVTTYPFYKKLTRICFGNKLLAALLLNILFTLLMIFIVIATSWLILGEFFALKEAAYGQLLTKVQSWFNPDEWNKFIIENTARIRTLAAKIPFVDDETATNLMKNSLQEVSQAIRNISVWIVTLLQAGLGKVGGFFIALFYFYLANFYFLLDGENILKRLFFFLPIKNKYIVEIENRFTNLFKSWVIGNIAIMLAQGSLAGIGFAIAGLPSPAIWGLIMIFMALIPFIGTTIIWAPAGILLLVSGHYGAGIFLLLWGVFVVGLIDNFLRPFLLRTGAHLSLFILFFAFLGGLATWGVKGLLLGPIILVFLDVILHIYSLEYGKVLEELNK